MSLRAKVHASAAHHAPYCCVLLAAVMFIGDVDRLNGISMSSRSWAHRVSSCMHDCSSNDSKHAVSRFFIILSMVNIVMVVLV